MDNCNLDTQMSVVRLGEPKQIIQMNIPSIPDEKIPIGTIVILWNEIPCRKIGEMLYEVFSEDTLPLIEIPEDDFFSKSKLLMQDFANRELETSIWHFRNTEYKKYVKTSKGSKKRQPWEPPLYF